MSGLPSGSLPGQGMHQSSPDADSWNTPQDYSNMNPHNGGADPSQSLNMGYLRGFPAMQKKTTRDGQPAKRRGPKPDSKPAQTRRQELNRQAQRTHRERKEQYIKALEMELSRLKEVYINESNNATAQIEQRDHVIAEQRRENEALRQILAANGIPFETELANRKMALGRPIKRDASNSLSPTPMSVQPYQYSNVGTAPSSNVGNLPMRDGSYSNGGPMSIGHSPGTTHHSNSPGGPDIREYSPMNSTQWEHQGVPATPMGIFEQDPQLGIDFILALERTCRDHDEYLVRKSTNSADTEEEAMFSGHALMATCPPPSHIAAVPAVMDGLTPTYDHKVPDVKAIATLNNLLNLSQVIKDTLQIPGGQVTPVMALQCLRGHRHYSALTREDVVRMIESVKGNVRCYGFGAVMEDFELRDALTSIFATKPETYEEFDDDYNVDIDDMYA